MSMSGWSDLWRHSLAISHDAPEWLVAIAGLLCVYAVVVIPTGAIMAFLDRKLGADFQARVGPNRSGPAGMLQPVADLLKLLQKESSRERDPRETLWLAVHAMALYSTVAVLPLGSLALFIDTDMSAFLPFWSALMLGLATMLLGLTQGSVSGWFGGARVAAQALSGAFPALVALVCAGIRAGGFRWSAIAGVQGASPFGWTALSNPFQFLAFLVFVVSGLVLLGLPPMEGGLAATDLRGGVGSHLSGSRLAMIRLGRFYAFFLWAVIAVVLFLGAWRLPEGLLEALKEAEAWRSLQIGELAWLLIKTFALMTIVIWVSRVNPRTRVDQITDFAWKVLSPFSLLALIGVALWAGWGAL